MNTSVIIVGQGLAGSVLAHELRKAGKEFVVIDSQDLSASSRVAPGIWNPVVFKRMTQSWMADQLIPAMHGFYTEAENFLGTEFLSKRKLLKFFTEEQEAQLWQKKANAELKNFVDPHVYAPEDLSINGINPPAFGFSYVTESGNIDTRKFIEATRKWLQKENRIVDEKFDYSALSNSNNNCTYKNISADKIVFSEGWLNKDNPYFNYVPFKPAKGEVFTFRCGQLNTDTILIKGVVIISMGDHLYKCGATYEWDELNDLPTEQGQAELEEKLRNMLGLPFEIVERSAGVRPSVIDRRPVLGVHPEKKQVFIFNGFGTKAVMIAPYFGAEMCKFMFGNASLPKEVDVSRFQTKFTNA